MPSTLAERFRTQLPQRAEDDSRYATELIEVILRQAREAGASDVHLLPGRDSLQMLWRIDGVLQTVAQLPAKSAGRLVSRLKVLSELLTYQTEVPQEGRIRDSFGEVEMRVSTFPTIFGEKAVVRLFAGSGKYRFLDDLGLPATLCTTVRNLLGERGGVLLVTGPAGSGKTTTLYACVREIIDKTGTERSLVSLEDPVESVVAGMAQSQVRPTAGFDFSTGLRSVLRQDPEVIMVGEIRDRDTAQIVFQASLTGHLVLTSFHSGSAAETVTRLADMGIEPFLLRSGILAILCQRLMRKLCECSAGDNTPDAGLGLNIQCSRRPVGCADCDGTGYRGRLVVAELLRPDTLELAQAILAKADADTIEDAAVQGGMTTRWQQACLLIEQGKTSPAEVRRVLGWS